MRTVLLVATVSLLAGCGGASSSSSTSSSSSASRSTTTSTAATATQAAAQPDPRGRGDGQGQRVPERQALGEGPPHDPAPPACVDPARSGLAARGAPGDLLGGDEPLNLAALVPSAAQLEPDAEQHEQP